MEKIVSENELNSSISIGNRTEYGLLSANYTTIQDQDDGSDQSDIQDKDDGSD